MTEHTFYDLDARVHMPSLYDSTVADAALDAYLDPDDRIAGGLTFLLCDDDGRLMQPILVSDVPDPATDQERWRAMRWAIGLCEMVSDDHNGPLSLVLGLVREDGAVSDEDRAWHQVALDACAEAGVTLIGVHVVTMAGVRALPDARSTAA